MAKSYNSYNKGYNGGSYGVFTQDRDSYDAYKDLYGTGNDGADNTNTSEGQDYSVDEALNAYKESDDLKAGGFQESGFSEAAFQPQSEKKWYERISKVKMALIAIGVALFGWLIFKKD